MIDNIKLFESSLKIKEPYMDKDYFKPNNLVITDSAEKLNKLMKSNNSILENIIAYKIALQENNESMMNNCIDNIMKALKISGINNSEFTSYWSVKDMSHSSYRSFKGYDIIQKEILKRLIPEFIKDRHSIYFAHGYSFSTLQAIDDSKAHKKSGNLGSKKVTKLFTDKEFKHLQNGALEDFKNKDKIFVYPDKEDKQLFQAILKEYNISFMRSKNHEKKQTDFLFKVGEKIFIMEHKHMKEAGGGQDKQMTEIIDFISYREENENIYYISFLDGIYFNLLSEESIREGKIFEQRESIKKKLEQNKNNYFVNTEGFKKLLESLITGG